VHQQLALAGEEYEHFFPGLCAVLVAVMARLQVYASGLHAAGLCAAIQEALVFLFVVEFSSQSSLGAHRSLLGYFENPWSN
jgi:hypothetical protein